MLKLRAFVALSMATLLAGSALAAPAARPAATKTMTTTSAAHAGRTMVSLACGLVSYRTACELGLGGLPSAGSGFHTDGMGDSPDGVDPLVSKGRNLPPASTAVTRTSNP